MCSVFSIIIGSLSGLNQTKIKRLVAYSGVTHIGFIILPLSLISDQNLESSLIYLVIYFSTITPLLIVLSLLKENYIILFNKFFISNKFTAILTVVFILSISGLPPFLGFLPKFLIFLNLLSKNYILTVIIITLITSISIAFYLRVVKIIFFQPESSILK